MEDGVTTKMRWRSEKLSEERPWALRQSEPLPTGAFALGAFAVGALAIGRMAVGSARIKRMEIDELIVGKLTIREK